MKAQDLKPGHVLIEHGHEFTITEVELPARRGWSVRVRSTLPGGAPHVHLLAPDAEVETMTRTITLAHYHAKAADRFGPRQAGWAYQCPACGDVATGADVMWALSQQPVECALEYGKTAAQAFARLCLSCGATADEYGTTTVVLPTGQQVRVFDLAPQAHGHYEEGTDERDA